MSAEEAQRIKFECIPGEGLDEHGLTKLTDPFNKFFPVAIVGIGVHMPNCENLTEFQKVLDNEECVLGPVPEYRWHHDAYYSPDASEKGKYCITKLGFYMKYFHFDPHFFNMSIRESCFIDAQQRQTIETTELALQDAGIDTLNVEKDTGVYVGMGIIDIPGALSENRHLYNGHTVNGMAHTVAANRISHHYGLNGPSCAVDTACAASMTAIHVAVMSMWNKECKMAIAGATSQVYSPECVIAFSQLGVLSPTGNSAPFDESNNGYVRSEGTGMVILKNIEDAVRDGDHIYCVIRGTTSAHNGYSMSLTLPSAPAQIELIQRCYEQFGVDIGSIEYVEAHGTGTPVGDPIEVTALGTTFGAKRPKNEPLRIASAKSSFGHLEVCAGMVQIIKAALMLEQRRYFKHINWYKPNHRMNLEDANIQMQLNSEFYTKEKNMLMGVNTFGFGGSLVHQILEEYRFKHGVCRPECLAGWSFGVPSSGTGRLIAIPFSARTKTSLRAHMEAWSEWSCTDDAQQIASWMATRRTCFKEDRLVVLANSSADFQSKVEGWLDGQSHPDVIFSDNGRKEKPLMKVCFAFSGWGQQWADMGCKLYALETVFRRVVNECDELFQNLTGYSALEKSNIFRSTVLDTVPDINGDGLKPAILFFQIGAIEQLKHWGVVADICFGIGLGELSAAYASGALNLEDTIKMMHVRMSSPPKADFIRIYKGILEGKQCSSPTFFSAITGCAYSKPLDAEYWWRNITEKNCIGTTVDNILKTYPDAIFFEVAGDSVLQPVIQETLKTLSSSALFFSCGRKDFDDRASLLAAISQLHVRGHVINWRNITLDCAKHAQMPLYVFDDEEIWFETINYTHRRKGTQDRSYRALGGKLNVYINPFLKSYHLDGKQLFPAAALVEYFTEHDESPYCSISDIEILHLTEVPEPDNIQRYTSIQIDIQKDGAFLKAVQDEQILAEAKLNKGSDVIVQPTINVTEIKSKAKSIVSGEELRATFEDLGLLYGLHYKQLDEVHVGDGEAIGFCSKPHPISHFERIEAIIVESAFQAAIGVFTRGPSLFLPKKIGRLQMYVTKVPSHTPYVVYIKLVDWSLKSLKCDLTIADRDGKVWAVLSGFEAASRAYFESDVDLQMCLYSQISQSTKASFKDLPEKLEYESEKQQERFRQLDRLAGAACSELIAKLTVNGVKEIISSFASPGGGKLQIPVNMGVEEDILVSLQDEVVQMTDVSSYPTEPLKKFLRSTPLMQDFFSSVTKFIKENIAKALEGKKVIRICEVGSSLGSLTQHLIRVLEDEMISSKVQYTIMAADDSSFEDINNYLVGLPSINYEILTVDSLTEFTNFFDIVISFDPLRQLVDMANEIPKILLEDGWYVAINQSGNRALSFLCGSNENAVIPEGFQTSKTYGSSNAFSMTIGVTNKTPSMQEIGTWSVVGSVDRKVLSVLKTLVPSVTSTSIPEIINLLRTPGSLNLVLSFDNSLDSWKTAYNLVNELRNAESETNVTLWVFIDEGIDNSALNALVRSQNFNHKLITLESVEKLKDYVQSGDASQNMSVLKSNNIEIPSLTRLSLQENQNSLKMKSGEVAVETRAITTLYSEKKGFVFAGVIEASSDENFIIGQRVVGFSKFNEPFLVCPSSDICLMPKTLVWSEAVDSFKHYTLAYITLFKKLKLKPGDSLLCTTPDSQLGLALIMMGKLIGAHVYTTLPSSQETIDFIRTLKAVGMVDSHCIGFQEDMLSLTGGKGVNAVVTTKADGIEDPVLEVLAVKAKVAFVGLSSASSLPVPNIRQVVVDHTVLMNTARGTAELKNAFVAVGGYIETKKLRPLKVETDNDTRKQLRQVVMKEDGSYIVFGGFGRCGTEVARWLAERNAKHIVLVNREHSGNNFDAAAVNFLEASGCNVHVFNADIKSKADVEGVFKKLSKAKAPAVKGVFNLIGSDDAWNGNEVSDLANALQGQAAVTMYLNETAPKSLDYFVAITSAVSMIPSADLPGITATAGFIDGLMARRQKQNLPGLALKVGLVRGVGSVSQNTEIIEKMEEFGFKSLHFHEYLMVLGYLLRAESLPSTVVVTNQNWNQTLTKMDSKNYVAHLAEGGIKNESGGGLSKSEMYELMAKELISSMTCCPIENIETTLPVQTYGVDSLMSQEIISWAEKKLKVTLSQAQVFAGLTIAQLVSLAL